MATGKTPKTSKAAKKSPSKAKGAARSAKKPTQASGKPSVAVTKKSSKASPPAAAGKSKKSGSISTKTATSTATLAATKRKAVPKPRPAIVRATPKNPATTAKAVGKSVRTTKVNRQAGSNGDRVRKPNAEVHDEQIVKTQLTDRELSEFRELLLEKRRLLLGDVATMEGEAIGAGKQGGGDLSSMPIHMADLGSDTWEQELTLGLIANERALLREIDDALHRIDQKTYGICLATHKPISKARLTAKPWAKYCIEYARKLELMGKAERF